MVRGSLITRSALITGARRLCSLAGNIMTPGPKWYPPTRMPDETRRPVHAARCWPPPSPLPRPPPARPWATGSGAGRTCWRTSTRCPTVRWDSGPRRGPHLRRAVRPHRDHQPRGRGPGAERRVQKSPSLGDSAVYLHDKAALKAYAAATYDYVLAALQAATPTSLSAADQGLRPRRPARIPLDGTLAGALGLDPWGRQCLTFGSTG